MKNESLPQSPEETAADAGVELAHQSNQAYDAVKAAQADQETLAKASQIEGVEVGPDTVSNAKARESAASDRFEEVSTAAGQLIGPNTLGAKAWGENGGETTKATEQLSTLTPEQQTKAQVVAETLAKKFELEPTDFGIVTEEADSGEAIHKVMLTAKQGIYGGSWNQVEAARAKGDFTIEVNGEQIDALAAMTEGAYRAFIAAARAEDQDPLPDSSGLDLWTFTLLTGEQADRDRVPAALVHGGEAYVNRFHRDDDNRRVRVRPAVVI